MEKTVGKATKGIAREKLVNPEEKWIRLQEVGLSQILAVPVALMLGIMFHLSSMVLSMIIPILLVSGYLCLKLGHDKRREIQDKLEQKEDEKLLLEVMERTKPANKTIRGQ